MQGTVVWPLIGERRAHRPWGSEARTPQRGSLHVATGTQHRQINKSFFKVQARGSFHIHGSPHELRRGLPHSVPLPGSQKVEDGRAGRGMLNSVAAEGACLRFQTRDTAAVTTAVRPFSLGWEMSRLTCMHWCPKHTHTHAHLPTHTQ